MDCTNLFSLIIKDGHQSILHFRTDDPILGIDREVSLGVDTSKIESTCSSISWGGSEGFEEDSILVKDLESSIDSICDHDPLITRNNKRVRELELTIIPARCSKGVDHVSLVIKHHNSIVSRVGQDDVVGDLIDGAGPDAVEWNCSTFILSFSCWDFDVPLDAIHLIKNEDAFLVITEDDVVVSINCNAGGGLNRVSFWLFVDKTLKAKVIERRGKEIVKVKRSRRSRKADRVRSVLEFFETHINGNFWFEGREGRRSDMEEIFVFLETGELVLDALEVKGKLRSKGTVDDGTRDLDTVLETFLVPLELLLLLTKSIVFLVGPIFKLLQDICLVLFDLQFCVFGPDQDLVSFLDEILVDLSIKLVDKSQGIIDLLFKKGH